MKRFALLTTILLLSTLHATPTFPDGVACDNPNAIASVEQIINKQVLTDGKVKVDIKNIIIWDYNKVGRYTCKARISGDIGTKPNQMNLMMYGLASAFDQNTKSIDSWIAYTTTVTTIKDGNYYVEVTNPNTLSN